MAGWRRVFFETTKQSGKTTNETSPVPKEDGKENLKEILGD